MNLRSIGQVSDFNIYVVANVFIMWHKLLWEKCWVWSAFEILTRHNCFLPCDKYKNQYLLLYAWVCLSAQWHLSDVQYSSLNQERKGELRFMVLFVFNGSLNRNTSLGKNYFLFKFPTKHFPKYGMFCSENTINTLKIYHVRMRIWVNFHPNLSTAHAMH